MSAVELAFAFGAVAAFVVSHVAIWRVTEAERQRQQDRETEAFIRIHSESP